jgi:hypothetical protein
MPPTSETTTPRISVLVPIMGRSSQPELESAH